jgi:hypothetical protein
MAPVSNTLNASQMKGTGKKEKESNRIRTAKETLHHNTAYAARCVGPDLQPVHLEHAPPVRINLDLAIALANIVQPQALGDCDPLPGREDPRTGADGGAVAAFALAVGVRAADMPVVIDGVGEVGVQLAFTSVAPHEACGEAGVAFSAACTAPWVVLAVGAIFVRFVCV